ncbi:MAG TPA: DUF4382 domain-containing protein [Chitinophagales bacterium]|nr:DUF4382 domain-containing protein [Chitinophagales bacterium]HRG87144.1 DUF4382 domain-containing protein [Chitinophagales bacterium]HRH55082.1 DUF4382 domain-containing protein [Chitinophagales bacterium]
MRKRNVWPVIIAAIALIGTITMTSCNKDNQDPTGTAHVNMYLTDAPADYDAVYIDVQSIEIISDAGTTTHTLLHPGVYDLLKFNSGVDTLMISEDLSPRTVSQIRLILGENNSVVVDGVSYPLSTPSAQTSGLKLNVHYTFEAGISYNLWMDFDASQSIVEQGNGDYTLKPVIRIFTAAESGAIAGNIFPLGAAFHVSAITATDTFGTSINADGSFLIGGLVDGSYDVKFSAVAGFTDITVPGVLVTNGSVTQIGEIIIPL